MESNELITKRDLVDFETNLFQKLSEFIRNEKPKNWLRSSEVRKILKISPGTLQNLRINGTLKSKKIGGLHYYRYDDIVNMLEP